MRLFLSCFFVVLLGGVALAQKSVYLKAEGGIGKTSMQGNTFGLDEPAETYRGALLGGIRRGNFNLEIGFGYGRTGGRKKGLLSENHLDTDGGLLNSTSLILGSFTVLHHHYTLPVAIGYHVPVSKRLSIQPRAGMEGAYNAKASSRIKADDRIGMQRTEKESYHQNHNKYSLFGSGALQLHYRVTPSVELYGGPSYRKMMTNLAKPSAENRSSELRTSTLTIDAGLLLNLWKEQKSISKPSTSQQD